MILPIKHITDWELICQNNQAQIKKDAVCENQTIITYDYQIGDDFLTRNYYSNKYETLFKGRYKNIQNGTTERSCYNG